MSAPRASSPWLVTIAASAPWLVLMPTRGVLAIVVGAVAFVAACHGAGALVWRVARASVRPHPLVAVQTGFAALLGVVGIAMAGGVASLGVQAVVVYGCIGVHSVLLFRELPAAAARLDALRDAPRWWLVPSVVLVGIGVVHVIAAAGHVGGSPFDADGNVLAQIQRLRDSGALADGVGYARESQLGGQVVAGSLAALSGDPHFARVLEAIAFVLAMGLVVHHMRVRDPIGSLWAVLAIVVGVLLAVEPGALDARWTVVGLAVVLYELLVEDEAPMVVVGLVAGAVIVLRTELWPMVVLPIAVIAIKRESKRSAVALVAGMVAVVAPFAIARVVARADVPTELFDDTTAFALVVWPVAIGGAIVAMTALARKRTFSTSALIVSLGAIGLAFDGRDTSAWSRRLDAIVADVELARISGVAAPVAGHYDVLLAEVPQGARVLLLVDSPERIDYRADLRFVDLGGPRIDVAAIEKLVAPGDFLLVERSTAIASEVLRLVPRANQREVGGIVLVAR